VTRNPLRTRAKETLTQSIRDSRHAIVKDVEILAGNPYRVAIGYPVKQEELGKTEPIPQVSISHHSERIFSHKQMLRPGARIPIGHKNVKDHLFLPVFWRKKSASLRIYSAYIYYSIFTK